MTSLEFTQKNSVIQAKFEHAYLTDPFIRASLHEVVFQRGSLIASPPSVHAVVRTCERTGCDGAAWWREWRGEAACAGRWKETEFVLVSDGTVTRFICMEKFGHFNPSDANKGIFRDN